MNEIKKITLHDGSHISYKQTMCASKATVVCLGGFSSEMRGPKALNLFDFCASQNIDCIVFDYLGHGGSSGDFSQYVISDWLRSCRILIEACTHKPLVLVGTCMGGWLMLHIAMSYSERVLGMIGFSASPDFTETLCISPEEKEEFRTTGAVSSYVKRMCGLLGMSPELGNAESTRMSAAENKKIFETEEVTILKNGRAYTITPRIKADGKQLLLLDKPYIPVDCDTTLVHSMADHVIPYTVSLRIAERVQSQNVNVHIIKSSNHLLNDDEPLSIAFNAIQRLVQKA